MVLNLKTKYVVLFVGIAHSDLVFFIVTQGGNPHALKFFKGVVLMKSMIWG